MKLASIELISEIKPHPNADKLELAKVLGYTCIVEKGKYKAGDAVVLIQPDTVLPDEPWAEMFKKRGNRVKAMKLRGIWSFGIVMSPYDVCDLSDLKYLLMPVNIGKDIADRIGVTKYEAPASQALDAKGPLPFGLNKTDEERCLSGTTYIVTNIGEMQIEELGIKPVHELAALSVLSYNTNSQECEFQKITGFISSEGKNEWYRITFEDGTSIECTDNHKIFLPTLQCFRRADELKVGDNVLSL
jgi:tRNA-binding EMAP/Myf-like protein